MNESEHVASGGFSRILYEVNGRVATITFNEPERMNPIGHGPGSMEAELLAALERANEDDDVRCVVVTGAGRAFSSGGDLQAIDGLETALDHLDFHDVAGRANEAIRTNPKPVIGAINGLCYGYALVLATHFDLLVAVDTAEFGLIETRFGGSGVQTLPFLVGPQWARFLAISGEVITARKAKEIGLVLEVFPEDVFQDKVYDLARRVAAMPAEGVMLNRRVINAAMMAMGWSVEQELALALNAVISAARREAKASDGRVLSAIFREDGWQAYRQARDAPFSPPWLEE